MGTGPYGQRRLLSLHACPDRRRADGISGRCSFDGPQTCRPEQDGAKNWALNRDFRIPDLSTR